MLLVSLIVQVAAALNSAPAAPDTKPNWSELRTHAETAIRADLNDPSSAQLEWTSGFAWGSVKPALRKRRWGWVACLSVNAKNLMGGYAGAERYWFISDAAAGEAWGKVEHSYSQCDRPGATPLQPELRQAAIDGGTTRADQLTKLAALLQQGLLTQAEFDREKRLLTDAASNVERQGTR